MANLSISPSRSFLGQKVNTILPRVTGSTCINPAIGICLQIVAAWGAGDITIFVRDVWPLIIPSVLGAILGGFFMTKFYEPLLMFIKYGDLADQEFSDVEEG